MTPEVFSLAVAQAADVPEIAQLHVDIWQQTYAAAMDPDFLAGLSVSAREEEWSAVLATRPEHRVLVARDSGGAFAGFGSAIEHGGEGSAALELYTLNLHQRAHGAGLARSLLDALLGDRPAFLWVVRGNERAIAFYRKAGFQLEPEQLRWDEDARAYDQRMTRDENAA